jgi:hypothetical protein
MARRNIPFLIGGVMLFVFWAAGVAAIIAVAAHFIEKFW